MAPKLSKKKLVRYLNCRIFFIYLITKPFLVFFLPLNYKFMKKFRKELIFRLVKVMSVLMALFTISFAMPFQQPNEIFLSIVLILTLISANSIRTITKLNFGLLLFIFFVQSLIFLYYFLKF